MELFSSRDCNDCNDCTEGYNNPITTAEITPEVQELFTAGNISSSLLYRRPAPTALQASYRESQQSYRESQLSYRESQLSYRESQLSYRKSQQSCRESQLSYRESWEVAAWPGLKQPPGPPARGRS